MNKILDQYALKAAENDEKPSIVCINSGDLIPYKIGRPLSSEYYNGHLKQITAEAIQVAVITGIESIGENS